MWNPLNISNCKLWLDATQITGLTDGSQVSSWVDLSGNNNSVSQDNSSYKPIYVANGINNKPSVRFTQGTNQLLYTKNVFTLNQNKTIFSVFKNRTGGATTHGCIWQLANISTSGFFPNWSSSDWVACSDSAWVQIPTVVSNNDVTHYSTIIYNTNLTQMYIDSKLTGQVATNTCTTSQFRVGFREPSHTYHGDISEIIVYNKVLTTDEINQVESYIKWKYENATKPSFMYNKILIKNNNYIMKYVDNSWINTNDTSAVDLNIFNQYGIDDISTISNTKWKELNKFKVYTYIEDTSVSLKTKLTGVSQPQICKMDTNFNLAGIKKINSLNITSNIVNNGIVKFMLSFNSGATWHSYNGTDWIEININDLTDCKNNGMTKDTLNSIPSDKLESLRNNGKNIRFAYYMEISNTTDIANIDKLNINVDMEGTWKHIPDNGTVYDYEFKDNTTLKISLYQANTYKINYPQ